MGDRWWFRSLWTNTSPSERASCLDEPVNKNPVPAGFMGNHLNVRYQLASSLQIDSSSSLATMSLLIRALISSDMGF